MNEPDYSIQELAEQSGVPRRTIHFYVQQGILPPPRGAGLAARYDETHLLRLRLIPQLRQQGLRLDDIRQKFQTLDDAALQQQLSQPKAPSPPPSPAAQPAAETFIHYRLPGDVTLVVPAGQSPQERQRTGELIRQAQRIWEENHPSETTETA